MSIRKEHLIQKEIVLVELFSGIGGFAKGLIDAGFTIKKHYFSEIDKHAIANYKYNFPDAEYIGSVKDVSGIGIEQPDIITFGWPCQDNSIAGKRKGQREGTRSGLLFEAGRIISILKPRHFIAENVKGLYSVNEGVDFYEAIRFLTYLNSDSPQYTVEMQLLNTSWFLPQNRERVYFIGHIGAGSRQRVFPIGENNSKDADGFINKIDCYNSEESQDSRIYSEDGISPTIGGGSKLGGYNVPKIVAQRGRYTDNGTEQQFEERNDGKTNTLTGVQKDNLVIHNMLPRSSTSGKVGTGHLTRDDGIAYCLDTGNVNAVEIVQHRGQSGEVRTYDKIAPTVSSTYGMGGGNIPYVNSIRRLTEKECERLQGYPDNWTEYGIYERQVWINKKEKTFEIVHEKHKIPKTQRYKLCGNAVTTNVVKAIGLKIKTQNNV